MWEEKRKIIDIVDEKTFQPGLRTGKKKPRLMERKGLFEEGLGRNKVLFGFEVKLQMAKPPNIGSPTLCQGDRSPATRRLLSLENQTDSDAFLVVSLNALRSPSFCWSSPLLFGGELDCWPSHWWRSVNGRKSCCRLVRMVLVERANELPKVLDR